MSIDLSDNNPRIEYSVAQGVTQTSFAIPFEFFDDSDVNIYVDGTLKTEGVDYTLTGGDGATGTASISVTGATGGSIVIILRGIALERVTDFTAGADINRAALNQQLDSLVAIAADLDNRIDRSFKISVTETGDPKTSLQTDIQPNSLLGFDGTGQATQFPVDSFGDITGVIAGSGLTGGGTSGTVTVSHDDTSSQASVDNSGGTVIQDVTLDTFGHVTGLTSYNLDGRYYTETEADSRFVNTSGDTMTGNLTFGDSDKAIFGAGSDLQIYHDGSNSRITDAGTGDLKISGAAVSIETAGGNLYFKGDANVATLYHTNVPKLATTATGIDVTGNATFGDNDKAIFGADSDLQIYHEGTNSYVREVGAGDLYISADSLRLTNASVTAFYARGFVNGAFELYHNGNKRLATTATGIDVTGNATFGDSGKAIFGASSDLQIYHDGSHSYIADVGTGNLRIRGTDIALQDADGNGYISMVDGGAGGTVYLKHLGSDVLTTTPTGVDVTGTVTADGLNVDGDISGGDVYLDTLDLKAIAASKAVTAVDVFVYDTSKDSDGGAWRKRTQHTSWYNETLNTATRGSRREFPAVAVIVAEAAKVTIYDGDDPALPMWMVFNKVSSGKGTSYMGGAATSTVSSISMQNGNLCVGSTGSWADLRVIYFLSDSAAVYRTDSYTGTSNIANRNTAIGVGDDSLPNLVNDTVNDVAMTVLPDAPIDPATGLQVPTIAVATAGGVSVITDSGAVYDSANTLSADRVEFVNGGLWWFANFGRNMSFASISDMADGDGFGDEVANNVQGQRAFYLPTRGLFFSTALSGPLMFGGGSPAGTVVSGLSRHQPDYTDQAKGMTALTTSTYNTGWMNGDIKGAFLSSTDATSLVASTLATDGFTSYADEAALLAAGYTYSGTSPVFDAANDQVDYLASGGGSFQLTNSAVNGIPNGTAIHIQVTISNRTAGSLNLQNNYITTPTTLGSSIQGNGTFEYMIVKNGVLRFTANPLFDGSIDSYTVKLADEDRSVNANGLVINGTVTRAAVATGAELVGYSGFSASNYLEQPYNSDLDFGTGDFCVMGWYYGGSVNGYFLDNRDAGQGGFSVGINGASRLQFVTSNSAGSFTDVSGTDTVVSPTALTFFTALRRVGICELYANGKLLRSQASAIDVDGAAPLIVGGGIAFPWAGSLALLRISATAPTAEQIKKIYNDEKVLFQENAAATLYGASDAVTALAHDPVTDLLHVGTSAGRSVFQGLRRVSNTTTAVGIAISASNGLVVEE